MARAMSGWATARSRWSACCDVPCQAPHAVSALSGRAPATCDSRASGADVPPPGSSTLLAPTPRRRRSTTARAAKASGLSDRGRSALERARASPQHEVDVLGVRGARLSRAPSTRSRAAVQTERSPQEREDIARREGPLSPAPNCVRATSSASLRRQLSAARDRSGGIGATSLLRSGHREGRATRLWISAALEVARSSRNERATARSPQRARRPRGSASANVRTSVSPSRVATWACHPAGERPGGRSARGAGVETSRFSIHGPCSEAVDDRAVTLGAGAGFRWHLVPGAPHRCSAHVSLRRPRRRDEVPRRAVCGKLPVNGAPVRPTGPANTPEVAEPGPFAGARRARRTSPRRPPTNAPAGVTAP